MGILNLTSADFGTLTYLNANATQIREFLAAVLNRHLGERSEIADYSVSDAETTTSSYVYVSTMVQAAIIVKLYRETLMTSRGPSWILVSIIRIQLEAILSAPMCLASSLLVAYEPKGVGSKIKRGIEVTR